MSRVLLVVVDFFDPKNAKTGPTGQPHFFGLGPRKFRQKEVKK